jgi:hypothetical protein
MQPTLALFKARTAQNATGSLRPALRQGHRVEIGFAEERDAVVGHNAKSSSRAL